MFYKSKIADYVFHAVAFFFNFVFISAMYTNHIDARSINVNSDIGKKFLYDSFVYDSYNDR